MALQASGTISISDLVTEFGGTAPHSLSEYYKGGGLVPSTKTVTDKAAASSSGTTSTDVNSIDVDVTVDGSSTGTFGNQQTASGINADHFQTFTIPSAFRNNGSKIKILISSPLVASNATGYAFNGTFANLNALLSGGVTANQTNTTQTIADGVTTIQTGGRGEHEGGNSSTSLTYALVSDTYELVITNDSSHTVNLTSSPWGNDATFTAGESKTVSDQSSNSWSWSHPAVTSQSSVNANVPTSGLIKLTDFYAAES